MSKKKEWRYVLPIVFIVNSKHLGGVEFANKWIVISRGQISIKKGYAWDGMSPSAKLPLIGWISPPEGKLLPSGFPESYYATLVHDALCQFRKEIHITKDATVLLFRELLMTGGFSDFTATLYASCVSMFGPQEWPGDDVPPPTAAATV